MRLCNMFFVLLLPATLLIVQAAAADTRYVGDQLIITLRQGKSTQHKILRTLKTGTPLEVLDEDESYLKVRTTDGVEGYVLRQYISSTPPKTQRIDELEVLNSSLQKKISSLEEAKSNLEEQIQTMKQNYSMEFSDISSTSAELEQQLQQALSNEQSLAEKYENLLAQSENVVEIAAERDRLLQQNKKLAADIAGLAKRNDKLADSRMIKWFLAGGGVFLFGWITGKISRKKRSRF